MEFIDGPAYSKLRKRTQVPLSISLHVMSMVLEGLRYAHDLRGYDGAPLQLVHRDLSPHNVLVTYDGDCKIVDFGIAKAMDSAVVTRSGLFKGKVTCMPPEQIHGSVGEAHGVSDNLPFGGWLQPAARSRWLPVGTFSSLERWRHSVPQSRWVGRTGVLGVHSHHRRAVPQPMHELGVHALPAGSTDAAAGRWWVACAACPS